MAVFDGFAPNYQETVEESIGFIGKDWEFFAAAKVDQLLRLMVANGIVVERCSVLDVGCGVGGMDAALAGAVGSLSGVDISAASIAEARRRHPTVSYEVYGGRHLPFLDGHFDVTFAACVLHHVPPARWDRFVGELHRVTRLGGLVVVFEHNPRNPLTRKAVNACPFDADAVLAKPGRVVAACRRAGGTISSRRYTTFLPVGGGLVRRAERALGWLPLGAQYVVASRPCGPGAYAGLAAELAKERVAR